MLCCKNKTIKAEILPFPGDFGAWNNKVMSFGFIGNPDCLCPGTTMESFVVVVVVIVNLLLLGLVEVVISQSTVPLSGSDDEQIWNKCPLSSPVTPERSVYKKNEKNCEYCLLSEQVTVA